MLDIFFNALNTWGPLGNLKQVPLAGGSAQQWANSSYSIVFGDSTNWILGFGRSTNIIGPDTKWVMDWNDLWNLIPLGKTSKWNYAKALLLGTVGATDLIIGPKVGLNYGTQDITVTSKKKAGLTITYTDVDDSKAGIRNARIVILCLGSLTTIALNVLARIANMSEALSTSSTTRAILQSSLQFSSNTLTPRMISLLTVAEVLNDCVKKLKEEMEAAKGAAEQVKKETEDVVRASSNLLIADLGNNQSGLSIEPRMSASKALLDQSIGKIELGSEVVVSEMRSSAPNLMGEQLGQLQAKFLEIENSASAKALTHASYTLNATEGPVEFNVSNAQASISLSPGQGGVNALIASNNTATLRGDNVIQIESGKHVALRVTDNQASQNNLTLNGTNITLECGAAGTGPSFTMNGDGNALTLRQGNKLLSPTVVEITNSKVEMSSTENQMLVGRIVAQPAQISLSALSAGVGSKISADAASINLSIGLAEITANQSSIKLGVGLSHITITADAITLEAVNLKSQAQMISELEVTIEKKVAQAMAQYQSTLTKQD